MGDAGRAHIARTFDLGAVANRWEEIYLRELQRARPQGGRRGPGQPGRSEAELPG